MPQGGVLTGTHEEALAVPQEGTFEVSQGVALTGTQGKALVDLWREEDTVLL